MPGWLRVVGRWIAAFPWRWCLKWSAVAGVWAFIAVAGLVAWYATDLPDVDSALAQTRRPVVTVLDAAGGVQAEIGDLHGLPVRLRDLPPALPAAVIATEDRRFWDHGGLDVIGLGRALVTNLMAGRVVQGGSTITQQVAKNLFLTPERTIKRKVQELLLSFWLEHKFTKEQILSLYLNRIYLGAGTWGVDAAARKYFGRPASKVTLWQSAILAGLPKAPSRYNPRANPKKAAERARVVLANMVAAGMITEKEAKAARASKVRSPAIAGKRGRHFTDWVTARVSSYVSAGDRDLRISTSLDPGLQALAESVVAAHLDKEAKKSKVGQAALVALAPDGSVRAMVGGRHARAGDFNRATQARRQPGSAFKPFVYLSALEAGYRPDTPVLDAPFKHGKWAPRNFSG